MNDQKLNNQQAFDIVAAHLLKQNAKSLKASGICAYRGVEGRQCAAGALMRDCDYHPRMENISIGELVVKEFFLGGFKKCQDFEVARQSLAHRLSDVNSDMLTHLQFAHDHSLPDFWPDRLRDIAHLYELNADVLATKG
jgi:hypothetical protein